MADKQISDLVAASSIQTTDLFVLEQEGTAKKLTGQTLIAFLTALADGHGGIASITWTTSGTSGNGQYHNATIHYADGTTGTFSIRDGLKGNKGDSWYMYFKYASHMPTSDADMGDVPDEWIGYYSGNSSTAPTHYTDYVWYRWKGDIGTPASLQSSAVDYQDGDNGTTPPTGAWSSTVPIVAQGHWLWTRTTLAFNSGTPVVIYTASRQGMDGEGAAGSAVPLMDAPVGDPGTSNAFAREDHQHPVSTIHITATLSALPATISDAKITADMRVINCVFGTLGAVTSDVAWQTSAGALALSGTMNGTTTVDIDLAVF